jgi:hypothetical protein
MHGHEYGNGYCSTQGVISADGAVTLIMTWASQHTTNAFYQRLRSFSGMNMLVCNVGKAAAATGGDVIIVPFA